MSTTTNPRWLNRMTGILGLFIGVFGAVAILGVFAKIVNYPGWELMMAIGFIGEAAAFVVMGILALVGGFVIREGVSSGSTSGAALVQGAPSGELVAQASQEYLEAMNASADEFRNEMRSALREHITGNVHVAMKGLAGDVEQLSRELSALGGELGQARGAVKSMSATLNETATGDLPESAERLGTGMRQLAGGMATAGSTVERLRADLDEMGRRFSAFNGQEVRAKSRLNDGVPIVAPKA